VCETMEPKLVAEDIPLLFSLLNDVFPGVEYQRSRMDALKAEVMKICQEEQLMCGAEGEEGQAWMEKVIQLYQITNLHHGLMMVGPSGSGKSSAWKVLLKALERLEGVEGVSHVIDPEALSKEDLYGVLDPNTREWTNGLFTHILRKIIDNVRGELDKRQWIIFDGDVDPEGVKNLNSVLDVNMLFTLPNGERLSIPKNVKITFEDVLSTEMTFHNYLLKRKQLPLEGEDESFGGGRGGGEEEVFPTLDSFRPVPLEQRSSGSRSRSWTRCPTSSPSPAAPSGWSSPSPPTSSGTTRSTSRARPSGSLSRTSTLGTCCTTSSSSSSRSSPPTST
jgi:dynein heavy chain 1